MMTNLFDIFDPSSSTSMSINWLSMVYFILVIPVVFWSVPSKYQMLWNMILEGISGELKTALNKYGMMNILIFISLFIFIFLNNFISLFPYIFTSTSHISISISMSLMIWFSMMFFGWWNFSNHMFIHLTPLGTPKVLMPFMVMIELISSVIRPLTLSVRLSANIIAGHLLITLMSQSSKMLNIVMIIVLVLVQCVLMSLEVAVSLIQSYVYSILSTLYSSEMS
uniref:ATP synthase subunit a n=1 Tax=Leptopilina boulardi TaxID=63433 RepID=A0A1L3MYB7_9HYME|nr:ATP synthase subunit 6 [Leptopilina boulardi]